MSREIDGIVCFGGVDWWYHNRGHYDLQMMRELSASVPVLYVNSIAMRMPKPSEGRMFARRVLRKWKSLRRGLVPVRPGFAVLSPFSLPGRPGMVLSRLVTPRQIRRAARSIGIRRPLVWVACPPAERFLEALEPVGVVYQRTDRYESFRGVDPDFIGGCSRRLESRADLTLFCSHLLMEEEADACKRALFLDHGVDYEAFSSAGEARDEPDDVRDVRRPRVGFVGGIDAHTFDPALFLDVARRLPDVEFVLVGGCSLPEDWCDLDNVTLLGQRPYPEVPSYMAAADVLVMPWRQSEWVRACNPVKLKEYLAVGRPIVTTGFDELRFYDGLVRVARGPEAFAREIRAALGEPHDAAPGRARVREETWAHRGEQLLAALREAGIRCQAHSHRRSPENRPGGKTPPGRENGDGSVPDTVRQ